MFQLISGNLRWVPAQNTAHFNIQATFFNLNYLFIFLSFKGDLQWKFSLMQMKSTAERWRMSLNFIDTLFHLWVTHFFVWLADDVILFAKSTRKYIRLTTCPKGNKVNDLSFKLNAFLKATSVDETMFIASILLSWNVSQKFNLTKIRYSFFPYRILIICKQNDVINWHVKSLDNLKTKWDLKKISTGFLINRQGPWFASIKIFASDHL